MTDTTAPPPALLVQAETLYGTRRLMATVVNVQPDGALHNAPTWDYSGSANAQYNAFAISCYLGDTSMGTTETDSGRLWGFSARYEQPYMIERPDHARAMAAVLTKVQKYLDRANTTDGYLSDQDFHGYVLRVAAALRIRTIYVRNHQRAMTMSGEKYRAVTGSALQSWIAQAVEHAQKGELTAIHLGR